jgi:hypothetical protein
MSPILCSNSCSTIGQLLEQHSITYSLSITIMLFQVSFQRFANESKPWPASHHQMVDFPATFDYQRVTHGVSMIITYIHIYSILLSQDSRDDPPSQA